MKKKTVFSVVWCLFLTYTLAFPTSIKADVDSGIGETKIPDASIADYGDTAQFSDLQTMFGNVLSVALQLIGIAMFVMIVVGGFKYLIAGGDAKATESAQSAITNAIIGLVLAIAAWFILLAIEKFTGVKVTQFNIIH